MKGREVLIIRVGVIGVHWAFLGKPRHVVTSVPAPLGSPERVLPYHTAAVGRACPFLFFALLPNCGLGLEQSVVDADENRTDCSRFCSLYF